MNLIAQIVQESPALYTYGPLGVICAWLMWRDERRAADHRSIGDRIDGLTTAILVDITERDTCGHKTKDYAQDEIAKIEARVQMQKRK